MSRLNGRIVGTVAVVLAALAGPKTGRACSISGPTPFMIDPAAQAADHVAPGQPALKVEAIRRGQGPDGNAGCGSSAGSCDDIGGIVLTDLATDDVTPVDKIGYRFKVVSGALPSGMTLPTQIVVMPVFDGQTSLIWSDGADDDHESFDFTLQIVAFDAAGNESAPQTLRIRDDQGGCRVGGVRGIDGGEAALVLCVLIAAAMRRRRPS